MDKLTIEAYDFDAEKVSKLHESLIPERLYQLALEYFIPGGKTLDIGCGGGRDTDWLATPFPPENRHFLFTDRV